MQDTVCSLYPNTLVNPRLAINNPRQVNQRREVQTDNIHLQFDSIVVVNHSANDGILDLAVM
jgi:hypothetical protein